jgi:PTH1 family peptidyl-tRNA hydrolase
MNESGCAVGAFAAFYRIAPDDILVAHDELDLPPGGIKLKFGGGLSGNGLKDVAAVLGTKDFWRLRIGIGHPRDLAASEQEVIDYVLHAPRADERTAIHEAIDKAMEIWPLIAAHDMQAAMLKLHTRARGEKREERGEEPPAD